MKDLTEVKQARFQKQLYLNDLQGQVQHLKDEITSVSAELAELDRLQVQFHMAEVGTTQVKKRNKKETISEKDAVKAIQSLPQKQLDALLATLT